MVLVTAQGRVLIINCQVKNPHSQCEIIYSTLKPCIFPMNFPECKSLGQGVELFEWSRKQKNDETQSTPGIKGGRVAFARGRYWGWTICPLVYSDLEIDINSIWLKGAGSLYRHQRQILATNVTFEPYTPCEGSVVRMQECPFRNHGSG